MMEEKPRLDLDEYYKKKMKLIHELPLTEVMFMREKLISEINKLDSLTTGGKISIGLRQFLKGKRKIVSHLLAEIKKRKCAANRLMSENYKRHVALQFMIDANQMLPRGIFELILAKALAKIENRVFEEKIPLKKMVKELAAVCNNGDDLEDKRIY